jgi:hypothetical protein
LGVDEPAICALDTPESGKRKGLATQTTDATAAAIARLGQTSDRQTFTVLFCFGSTCAGRGAAMMAGSVTNACATRARKSDAPAIANSGVRNVSPIKWYTCQVCWPR